MNIVETFITDGFSSQKITIHKQQKAIILANTLLKDPTNYLGVVFIFGTETIIKKEFIFEELFSVWKWFTFTNSISKQTT